MPEADTGFLLHQLGAEVQFAKLAGTADGVRVNVRDKITKKLILVHDGEGEKPTVRAAVEKACLEHKVDLSKPDPKAAADMRIASLEAKIASLTALVEKLTGTPPAVPLPAVTPVDDEESNVDEEPPTDPEVPADE